MKKSLLASIWAITASMLAPKADRERPKQHYRALPKTNTKTEMPVVNTPPMTEAGLKRVKERQRKRKAKRGF